MAVGAFTTAIKYTGTAVAMTTEATTSISATVYQITDTAKRIIDPDNTVAVVDNGVAVADADVTVDYLFGKITKTSGSFTGPVTVTANYLPTFAIAEARAFEFSCSAEILDSTLMAAATATRARTLGLKDCSGSFTGLDNLRTDLDSGGETIIPFSDRDAGVRRVVEITFSGGTIFRAFVKFTDIKQGGDKDGLFESTLSWVASAATGIDQTESSSFGFSAGG